MPAESSTSGAAASPSHRPMQSAGSAAVAAAAASGTGAKCTTEFQAVILATSQGSALYPLTREEGEGDDATDGDAAPNAGASASGAAGNNGGADAEALGRAQLPVANRPLLWYQLDMVSKAGFPHVLVVTRDSMRRGITRVIDEWKVARGGAPTTTAGAGAGAASATAASAAAASAELGAPATPTPAQLSASPSLASLSSSPPLLDIELACIETYRGAADALRQVAERISTDFFCLSGDLVSNVQFQNLADLHRSQDAGVIICVQDAREAAAAMGGGAAGAAAADKERAARKEKEDASTSVDAQYLGIDDRTGRLLLFQSAADVEESLSVPKRLLRRHPNFTLHTHLRDCRLYVFSQWVLFFLQSRPSIMSINSELLPCLVAGQYKAKYAEWRHYGKNAQQLAALRMSHASRKENSSVLYGSAASGGADGLAQPILDRAFSAMHLTSSSSMTSMSEALGASPPGVLPPSAGGADTQESFRLFVYTCPSNTFAARGNTLANYKALNHELALDREYAYMPWPSVGADNQAAAVGRQYSPAAVAVNNYSVVGTGVTFTGEGTTIKRSCVARGCSIGARVKMQGCVVLEGVTIEEGCSLTDCIIGAHAVIGKGSVLKDCKIGPNFVVDAATESKNEILCKDE